MYFFNLILAASITLVLTSCNTKRNPYFGDDDAQFYVGSIEKDKEFVKVNEQSREIYGVSLTFVACLKTLSGDQIPPHLKFDIIAGKDIQTRTTNKDGCIDWNEEHTFEPNQYERYLRLNRIFVSKNEYSGKREHNIFWNIKSNDIKNDLETKTPPEGVEDPIENSFKISNAQITKQNFNILADGTANNSNNKTRLVLSEIELTRVKLNQETPYKVDRNLTLYAQHTYKLSASPKFYIKTFQNPETEVVPSGGKYKVTLVFLDDPHFDLEKIYAELDKIQTLSNLTVSKESQVLKTVTDQMLSTHEMSAHILLTEYDKKQILAKLLLGHVHATTQFIADKSAVHSSIEKYIDLNLKKLSLLDVRSVLAVTIENISTGQSQYLKGHSVGYINNLLSPGATTLFESPIEADRLYSLYSAKLTEGEKLRPYDMYMQTSNAALKERGLQPLDLKNLSKADFKQDQFPQDYPFKQQLEKFLSNTLDTSSKIVFLRSLCSKLFLNDDLRPLDDSKTFARPLRREEWRDRCQLTTQIMNHYDLNLYDFVESIDSAKVSKYGKSNTDEITASNQFKISSSQSQSSTSSHEHWTILLGNFLVDGVIDAVKGFNPVAGVVLGEVIKFSKSAIPVSFGGNWYWARSSERSKEQSDSTSIDSSEKLSVNIDTYKIDVETRHCLVVSYNPNIQKFFKENTKINLKKGFVACSEKTSHPHYTENYYMVTQACSEDNGTTDCASEAETKLRIMIRGQEKYQEFKKTLVEKNIKVLLDPISSQVLEEQKNRWPGLMDSALTLQIFPGVLPATYTDSN